MSSLKLGLLSQGQFGNIVNRHLIGRQRPSDFEKPSLLIVWSFLALPPSEWLRYTTATYNSTKIF